MLIVMKARYYDFELILHPRDSKRFNEGVLLIVRYGKIHVHTHGNQRAAGSIGKLSANLGEIKYLVGIASFE